MMKLFPPLILVASIFLFMESFLSGPLVKLPTRTALDNIERDFLNEELDEEEKKRFESLKKVINWNQQKASSAYFKSTKALLWIIALLSIHNLILLYKFLRRKRPN
ncbi:hypothetical protein [Persicirhabdus sediminis]|uniref:hypothetical protein n=1 Tax=Persicirhabdus sediminis TaxID=454144 RepID=UPI001F38A6F1|nr:hypothetical protein [Persicirhabdus sediminis]